MTTTVERAETFAAVLQDSRTESAWRIGNGVTTYWSADMLDEGSAWIKKNADILPPEIDASWRRMDNGPLLQLRMRRCGSVGHALAVAYALSDRFGVGVSTHQPAGVDVVGVSVERISTCGFRVGGLRIDFSASARLAVTQ